MSLQTGRSQNSYTLDAATELKDAGAVSATGAAQVDSADRVLDFGNVTSGPAVEQVAYTPGDLVVDISAFDFGTGDETAVVVYQLSDDLSGNGVGFDAGDTVVNKVALPFGAAGGLAGSTADDDSAVGRVVTPVDNEHKGVVYRFARLFTIVGGTTPSINYTGFLSRH